MSDSSLNPVSTIPTAGKRVLSGMRPTGKLHLGNYMGALHNWVRLQHEYDSYFFIADWHALTTDYADPSQIKQNTVDVALDFLAAGLDPEKCTIFIQSHVRQHAELHLLFSMLTPLGWLERVPSYKDQQANITGKDLSTYGFLGYPLLQSADILLYQPDFVPVGADQEAHIELTREVARRFNSMYKTKVFPEPAALLTPTPKLPGIDGRKMSKSYGNTIGLSEPPASASAKVQTMSTNGQRIRQSDPGDPDLCPVGDLHKVFSSGEVIAETQAGCRTASIPCAVCKAKAAVSITAVTAPIYEKRMALESRIDDTWAMLVAQSNKASKRAEETMEPVRELMNISRDLGSVRRNFGAAKDDVEKRRDLSQHADLLTLPEGVEDAQDQHAKKLRAYWRENIVPFDIPLSEEPNRKFASIARELEEPLLTAKKKRIFVGVHGPVDAATHTWNFKIPLKSYELWSLLVVTDEKRVEDFLIPQHLFAGAFAARKKLVKTRVIDEQEGLRVQIVEESGCFSLVLPEAVAVDITDLRRNYKPLR